MMDQGFHQEQRAPYVPSCNPFMPNQGNHDQDFIKAMHQAGIDFRDKIIADGTIHRFSTGKKGQKDGWYVNFGLAGAFGDWRKDIHEKWSLRNDPISGLYKESLLEQIEKTKKAAEEEKHQKYEETAKLALEKWNSFSEEGDSLYLLKKKVEPFGVRFHKEFLVIPVKDVGGKLWSLQWIGADDTKRFLPGGRKKGCFHHIGQLEEGKSILICEGYATGASLYMAAQQTVVIAFDAGNLDPVIKELRKAYPNSLLTIAGDDDVWKEKNTGRTTAEQAALKYSCFLVFPSFKNTFTQPTDFNDLHVLEGASSVKEQIEKATQQNEWPEPTPLKMIKGDLSPLIPLPPDLIPEPYRDWLIDIAERMQCPLDYVAVGSLIITASLIGAGCAIRPKSLDSWMIIPNLWGASLVLPVLSKVQP